jgi:hypothetical protein
MANIILGAWLAVSPRVLGVSLVPTVNFVIVGLLVLAVALYEIWDERRHTAYQQPRRFSRVPSVGGDPLAPARVEAPRAAAGSRREARKEGLPLSDGRS